jgi:hypothetical protein
MSACGLGQYNSQRMAGVARYGFAERVYNFAMGSIRAYHHDVIKNSVGTS